MKNKCLDCGQKATIHLTDIVFNKKSQMHLCEACGRRRGLVPDSSPQAKIDIQALVQLIVAQNLEKKVPEADSTALKCPECGLKYGQFRAEGRFGCPHDYDVFRDALLPLLDRIHRAQSHTGKSPNGKAAEPAVSETVRELRRRLTAAVAAERYEEAAALRDRIRHKDTSDEPG